MKILEGSSMPFFDSEEESEIIDLVKKTKPTFNSKLSVTKIKEDSGWAYITSKINDSEFSIKYSSCMFDTSYLIRFFAEIIALEKELVLVLDYEGSDPILYAEPIDENNVRFIFTHDYNLFLNNNIGEYKISDYKIECDIVINKKELLKKFYNILYPFTMNYNLEKSYHPEFDIKNGKKYLKEIEAYIGK